LLYAGICIDLDQRVEFREQHRSQGDALRREVAVKKWSKERKERLAAAI
jgi:predicted GIY-YIG superfamily endonuclease